MRIVLMGKPGSGKGTQAAMLARRSGLPHLSSGEVLRVEIRDGTPFGRRVEPYVRRGEIGPAGLIARVVAAYIERKGIGGGFILDGFPRTLLQAELLDRAYPPHRCILLDIRDETAVVRLGRRLVCPGCGAISQEAADPPADPMRCERCASSLERREDDREEAIRKRLAVFRDQVIPVVERYRLAGLLATVDAERDPELVHGEICTVLGI